MAEWVRRFTDEQARALVNLRPRYEALIEAEAALAALPYNLVRKTVGGREYLYEAIDRLNNGKSLGPMRPELEQKLADYRSTKADQQGRRATASQLVQEIARLAQPLRLPVLSSGAGEILRELDRRGLLGEAVLVVGTSCIPAYSLEAGGLITEAPAETEDFDLTWVAEAAREDAALWAALKAVDPTFTVNTERPFQARNRRAYEVELLVAPSREKTLHSGERPRPVPMPEQEWLLPGRWVDQVLPCRDGTAARLIAPDPRWFALHKIWMADQPSRNTLKRDKDRKQGIALLGAVAEAMPHYPLDEAFVASIPPGLAAVWRSWRDSCQRGAS